jgi:phage tail sheath protein FI
VNRTSDVVDRVRAQAQQSLAWAVGKQDDEQLWMQVRTQVTDLLVTVWRNGELVGTKPEEAFFVRCDRTTMTQNDIDNGRLIVVIGIAPVKPAEFVVISIAQLLRPRRPLCRFLDRLRARFGVSRG